MSSDADKLKAEVIEARRNVRKKFLQLRMADADMSEGVSKLMKPIIDPLKEISKKTVNPTPQPQVASPPSSPSQFTSSTGSTQFASPIPSPIQLSPQRSSLGSENDDTHIELDDDDDDASAMYTADFKFNPAIPIKTQLLGLHDGADSNILDTIYGPEIIIPGRLYRLGKTDFKISEGSDIIIDGRTFKGTPGMYELIFLRHPREYTQLDFRQYGRLLERTNAARAGSSPSGRILSNRSYKYIHIIKPLLTYVGTPVKGSGMEYLQYTGKPVEYRFWNDPNELVERLILLHASRRAGNEACGSEIHAIETELREAEIIY